MTSRHRQAGMIGRHRQAGTIGRHDRQAQIGGTIGRHNRQAQTSRHDRQVLGLVRKSVHGRWIVRNTAS